MRSTRCSCGVGRPPRWRCDLGITTPETLRKWVRQTEIDRGLKPGITSEEKAELLRLRREVADQQRTIEILKAASAFFAQEANRRPQ